MILVHLKLNKFHLMKSKLVSVVLLVSFFISCNSQNKFGNSEVDPLIIQKNFIDWWTYQSNHIMLSSDFIALDLDSKIIEKEAFLKKITEGFTIPIRLQSNDSLVYYKLYPLEPTSDSNIKPTIIASAIEEYEHYKMEGTKFPDFKFVDLEGKEFTNESIKNKIVVIKCWYIHCTACVKEFPQVNALADKYKDQSDILFLSLAEDTPEQLKVFLARKPLSYSVVPNQKKFMNETLFLNAFPTHFILNKQGFIAKVLMNFESLEAALEIESKKL
jgi:peroxiredoxin